MAFPRERSAAALDGRLLFLVSTDSSAEPRRQISDGPETQLVFGTDVEGWAPGVDAGSTQGVRLSDPQPLQPPAGPLLGPGTPQSIRDLPPSRRKTSSSRPIAAKGQQWNAKAGQPVQQAPLDAAGSEAPDPDRIALDQEIPPIPDPPEETKYIKHLTGSRASCSPHSGAAEFLGAHVLLPEGFDSHPEARYPLVINHGHFPGRHRRIPARAADPNLKPDYSARFSLPGYNRIQQEQAHQFYKDWTGPGFPRVLWSRSSTPRRTTTTPTR